MKSLGVGWLHARVIFQAGRAYEKLAAQRAVKMRTKLVHGASLGAAVLILCRLMDAII